MIKDVGWRLPEPGGRKSVQTVIRKPVFRPAEDWPQPPAKELSVKPRVAVTLINRGPNMAEGVLLRYAVDARLVKVTEPSSAGVWTVPFHIEEKRVPFLKANQTKEIPIDSLLLATYFKKIFRAGYWPNAIKIQVVVEPRPGENLYEPAEKVLPVRWKHE